MAVAMPHISVLILVVEPFLMRAVQAVGVGAVLVGTVIGLEVVYDV